MKDVILFVLGFIGGIIAGITAAAIFGRKVSTLIADELTKAAAKVGPKG